MWDLIVSVPDHCLSFYYVQSKVELLNYLLNFKREAFQNIDKYLLTI